MTSASVPSSRYGYSSIAFSPNGGELVTTHGTERVPDPQIFAPDGSEVRSWTIAESGQCSSATFSPDGSRVAAACGQWLRIWNAATGAVIQNRKIASTIY